MTIAQQLIEKAGGPAPFARLTGTSYDAAKKVSAGGEPSQWLSRMVCAATGHGDLFDSDERAVVERLEELWED